ncbi:hypothetical protein C1637_09865 [Chryseobacterium lactis]|uniref:Uncharacterized protein n=2 Tax=Chryseobacterium lactis TaxID=1241981 RepID=A0A3G6RKK0_CHRLC|nr:hypothetical protein EG342_09835 [Chryseobacterium lactis]AZB02564.1 hypothetical protein EG341_00690 [Chryseobacterium lactis]PNW14141.1 hypothetical protein C1637_09865 [Chryseobacterium lactis]
MAFMASNDLDITRADTFVEGKSVKQGAQITMGADLKALINIQTGKCTPVLFFLNNEQYKLLSSGNTDLETLKSKQ